MLVVQKLVYLNNNDTREAILEQEKHLLPK